MARGAASDLQLDMDLGQRLSRLLMLRGKVFLTGGFSPQSWGRCGQRRGLSGGPKKDGVVSKRFTFGTSRVETHFSTKP